MAGHKVLTCFLQFLRLIGIEGEERICSVAVLSARKLPHWRKPPFVWISNAFTRVCEQRHVPYRVARRLSRYLLDLVPNSPRREFDCPGARQSLDAQCVLEDNRSRKQTPS